MKYLTATPYIASYVIIRQENKIAFVLRSNTDWMSGFYGLPSGKVEQKESFSEAALREAEEEIGITITPTCLRHVLTMHRQSESDGQEWVDVFFEASEWTGELHNAEPEVHSELAWLDPQILPDNVIPSVCYALERIAAGDYYCEYGWK